MLKKAKNRIIDNPFNQDAIDMILETELSEKRYLGTQQENYVQRFSYEANQYCNQQMDCYQGRWEFEFFHSVKNVLYHTDTVEGNEGNLGCIVPLAWGGHQPATIMYRWWSEKRVMYQGGNRIAYYDTGETIPVKLDKIEEDLVFEWDTEKALIFNCQQLHSARRFGDGAWKQFLVGFVV